MQPTDKKKPKQLLVLKSSSKNTEANKQTQTNSPYLRQISSPSEVDSPTRRKKRRETFITQKNVSEVQQTHHQLNRYIEILDTKVTSLIERHESEFLMAYRNHIKKVREEMDEIRSRALNNANANMTQTEKIQSLEKQLTLFRQESLKLYEKINEKQNTIANLKSKINELESDKVYLERNVKVLTKRNKYLQGLKQDEQSDYINTEQAPYRKDFSSQKPSGFVVTDSVNPNSIDLFLKTGAMYYKSRPETTAIQSKGTSVRSRNHSFQMKPLKSSSVSEKIDKINQKINKILGNKVDAFTLLALKQNISQILKEDKIEASEKVSVADKSMMSNTGTVAKHKWLPSQNVERFSLGQEKFNLQSKHLAKRSQLEEYFFKCISTVRKDIARRKGLNTRNFYNENNSIGLEEFKKIDFFRLLELLFSNENIIQTVYRCIFEGKN